jgi:hypothetical protein
MVSIPLTNLRSFDTHCLLPAKYSPNYDCFPNLRSDILDAALQAHFGMTILGKNAFSVCRGDYKNTWFDILMNRGRYPFIGRELGKQYQQAHQGEKCLAIGSRFAGLFQA